MSSQQGDGSIISPLSAATIQPYGAPHSDPEANAPEVVDISTWPHHHHHSSSVASPTVAGSSPGSVHSTPYSPTAAAHHTSDPGKEVIHYHGDGKMVLSAEEYTQYPQVASDLHAKGEGEGGVLGTAAGEGAASGPAKGKKILGMRRTVFFIVLAAVCIAIAVAVGAGVGATLSNKSRSSGDVNATASGGGTAGSASSLSGSPAGSSAGASPTSSGSSSGGSSGSSSPQASSTPSPSKSSGSEPSSGSETSSTTTSAATATPTFLNETTISNGQGWGFQGFSNTDYSGDYTALFLNDADFVETEKGIDFKIAVKSYQWTQKGTNCCVSFCNDDTHAGWVGYQCQAKKQPKTSETFTRVWIWCSSDHQQPNAERCGPS